MQRLVQLFVVVGIAILVGLSGVQSMASIPKQPLTLQLSWIVQTQDAGYFVALDKGWYREEGIDLKIEPNGPGINKIQRLATGRADVLVVYLPDELRARDAGLPLVRIGQLFQSSGTVLISHKELGVDSPEKLKGHQLGVWFGNGDTAVLALLQKYGIDSKKDVKLVDQDQMGDIQAFLEGKLEVASAWTPNELLTVFENGIKRQDLNIIDLKKYGTFLSEDGFTVTENTLRTRSDALARWMVGTIRGWRWAVTHPVEATKITLKYIPKGQPADYRHQLGQMYEVNKLVCSTPSGFSPQPVARLDPKIFEHNVQLLNAAGGLKKPIGSEAYSNTVWDQALQIMKKERVDSSCPAHIPVSPQ
jgi:NitT/TauT family transport system substrate-binding protein